MEQQYTISDFSLRCNLEAVLKHMNCSKTSSSYELVLEAYQLVEERIYQEIHPLASFRFGIIGPSISESSETVKTGAFVIYCFITLGKKVSELSNDYFKRGDCLAGLLADLMTDLLLFQAEEVLLKKVEAECRLRKKGIQKRLETPKDISMKVQKVILEEVNSPLFEEVKITQGYMYDPLKSTGLLLLLTEDCNIFQGEHNCNACESKDHCTFQIRR